MKSLVLRLATVAILMFPNLVSAQSGPVVVELFTSQGCSSCPPADDYLAGLVGRDDILPLSFHVDYWDRLGWKDTLGSPEFTARQYAYSHAFRNRSVWTPQFVVGGVAYSKGSFRDFLPKTVKKLSKKPAKIKLSVVRKGANVLIGVERLSDGLPPMLISVIGYIPEEIVQIKRGENAGRSISYRNTVRTWTDVGKWDGRKSASLTAPMSNDPAHAVIVQATENGPIMAAAYVR